MRGRKAKTERASGAKRAGSSKRKGSREKTADAGGKKGSSRKQNKKLKPEKTPYHSWKIGSMPKGCRLCVQGRKLVLFVTGVCSRPCFYCPLADTKKNLDVIYANEWKLENENDTGSILEEARLTGARGAGITGGDPLARLDRTLKYIRLLKRRFGKSFHIHLYTLPELISEDSLAKLHRAGLDELRLHPDIENKKHWWKADLAREFSWDLGIEIPVIPGKDKEISVLINNFKDKIDFLNLNELEVADSNAYELLKRGFKPKDGASYGVEGSRDLAMKLMKKYAGDIKSIHYCTTTLKDRVQLASRIIIRARKVRKPFDEMTRDGMLVRGALYLPELAPGAGYRRKLEKANKERLANNLEAIMKDIAKRRRIPSRMMAVDRQKPRILTSKKIAGKLKKEEGIKAAVVTEYPTWDQTETDVRFL